MVLDCVAWQQSATTAKTNPKSSMCWDFDNKSTLCKVTLRCFWPLIVLQRHIFVSGPPTCFYGAFLWEHRSTHASMLVAWVTSLLWFHVIQQIGDTDVPKKILCHLLYFQTRVLHVWNFWIIMLVHVKPCRPPVSLYLTCPMGVAALHTHTHTLMVNPCCCLSIWTVMDVELWFLQ